MDPRERWIRGVVATGLEIDEALLQSQSATGEAIGQFLRAAPGSGSSLFFHSEKEEVEVDEQYEEEYEEAATPVPTETIPASDESGAPVTDGPADQAASDPAVPSAATADGLGAAVAGDAALPEAAAPVMVTKRRAATRKICVTRDRCRAVLGMLPDVATKVVYFVRCDGEAGSLPGSVGNSSSSYSGGSGGGGRSGATEALEGIEFGILTGDCLSNLSGLIKEIYAPWLDHQLQLGTSGGPFTTDGSSAAVLTAGMSPEADAFAAAPGHSLPGVATALLHETVAVTNGLTMAGGSGSEAARNEFRAQLQRFERQVTHAMQQVRGDVHLSVPGLEAGVDMDDPDVGNDFEAVQQLEAAMEDWTRLIAGAVEAENGKRAVGRGPLAEADFWRRRHASLSALHEQIGLPRVQKMLRVLEEVEAPMLPTFQYHLGELSKLYAEARDNVKFLATLERHFKNLATGSFATVLDTLPSMMHAIRMVWTISRHYNTDERLVPLMERIAAELASRIEARVDVRTVLQHPPEAARQLITEARKVLEAWLSTYMATRHKIEESGTDHRWEFDRKRLFEQTNYMARVCGDLLEVATVLDQFRKFLGPELKSVTGESAGIDRIVASVDALVTPLEKVPFDIFDRKYKDSWHAVMQNFRAQVESIEGLTKSFIEQSFQKLRSAEGAFELVQNFKNIQSRESINQQINERYKDILTQYTKELDHVAGLFAAHHACPPRYKNYPPVAGAIAWAQDLYHRAKRPILRFKAHAGLLTSPYGDQVKQRYLTFARAVDAYVAEMYSAWEQQVGLVAAEKLKQPILCSKAAAEAAVLEAAAAASTAPAAAAAALAGRMPTLASLSLAGGQQEGAAPSATVMSTQPGGHHPGLSGIEDPAKDFIRQQQSSLGASGQGAKASRPVGGGGGAAGDMGSFPGAGANGSKAGTGTAAGASAASKIPPPPYAINFAPDLELMIRESKQLDRMGFSIPEGALNVTLQEDKFNKYCRELELMLRTYDSLSASLSAVETRLLKKQVAGLHATLRAGFTPLNWNSQRIPAFLEACNRALHEFQGVVSQIHKSAAMIGEVVTSIERMVLVRERDFEAASGSGSGAASSSSGSRGGTGGGGGGVAAKTSDAAENGRGRPLPPMDVSEFYEMVETKRMSRLDGLARKYSSIESLLIKVEEVVAGTNSGAAPALAGYYHYWEKRVLNAVTRMVLASMATFLSLLQSRDRPPLCQVHATLNGKDLIVTPAVNEVYKFLTRSVKGLVESAKAFRRWMHGTCREAPAQGGPAGDEEEPFVFTFYMDLSQNPHVIKLMLTLNQAVHKAFQMTNKYLDGWRRYDTVYNLWNPKRKQALDKLAEKDLSCVYFDTRIASYELLAETVRQQPSERDIEFLRVDCSAVAAGIAAQADQWCQDYGAVLHQCSAVHLERLSSGMAQLEQELDAEPQDLESLKALLASISRVAAERMDTELAYLDVTERYRTLAQYRIQAVPGHGQASKDRDPHGSGGGEMMRAAGLAARWEALDIKARTKDLRLKEVKDKFREVTRKQAKDFVADLRALEQEFKRSGPSSSGVDLDEGVRILATFQERAKICAARKAELVNAESLFGLEPTEFAELSRLSNELRRLERVYALYAEHKAFEESNSITAWAELDVAALQAGTEALERRAMGERELREHPVFRAVETRIHDFKGAIPLILSLKNDAMKQRHWARLGQLTGVTIDFKDPQVFKSLTLGSVFAMELHRFEADVGETVNEAAQEQKIELELKKMEATWRRAELPLQRYSKGGVDRCYVLRAADEVKAELEDNMLNLQTIAGSRFVGSFAEQVRGWEKTLNLVNETLDVWYSVQRKWMYLESIFVGAEDIRQQLPEEAKRFDGIDKAFKQVMAQTYQSPNVVEACTGNTGTAGSAGKPDGLLQVLQGLSERLDTTQKSLSDYLDTKRNAFPRFFFISDDELLSVLGSSDPTSIQVHLLKLFDNTKLLTFMRGGKAVTAMTSSEGESFALRRPVPVEGAVESWMTDVEAEMAASLRHITKTGVYNYAKEERTEWLKQVLGMVSLVGSQIWWTWEVEDAFRRVASGAKGAMKELEAKLTRQLNELVAMVREQLDDATRKKVNTLLIIDVHARDIVDGFVRESVLNAKEFAWESQLRFYWDRVADDCRVKQCTGCFSYGYEYMGLNGRLVITPLTDRCYMTLTQALTFKLGGAPAGPAGTGKTETTKDLAKSLALPCFVINCGEGLDYQAMASIFAGLIQVGAWGCFDEFNRINIEVLSVVSAQLKALQNALIAGSDRVDIGVGGEIKIRTVAGFATVGVFITMNPGYAGRTELPDNLKALFRPVTMVVPDLLQICEIMLFSEGFEGAKALAKKMTVLYKLSREQLSRQYHYDFGLRALKSVLVIAGGLKRQYAAMSEDLVLMRALRDSNMPKFVFEDVPLFSGLVNDLFPGMDCPRVGYEDLKAAAAQELEARGCRCSDDRVFEGQADKCVQLHETQLVRHTTMIVGPTGGGKTTVLDALRAARLAAEGITVRQFVLNPKKQPLNELYGVMDPVTRDWTDGVLSKLFRELNEPLPPGREGEVRWLVYDGDVDAVWVENMNSVMDDNRILTLPNGERIRLQPHCAMICETFDLQYASPATISRCGMVWVDPKNLGYRPFYERWVRQRCGDGVTVLADRQPEAAMLTDLFEKYVPACVDYVLQGLVAGQQLPKLRQVIPITDLGMVRQLCSSLDAFLGAPAAPAAGAAGAAAAAGTAAAAAGGTGAIPAAAAAATAAAPDRTDAEGIYIFCVVWSLGAALVDESRDRFDDMIRKLSGEALPSESLYGHFYDREAHKWDKWSARVPTYTPPEPFRFHKIAVPTTDSVLHTHLLQALAPRRPLLLVGESGTAKTATVGTYLSQLDPEAFGRLTINFSSRTTSLDVQSVVESGVDKRAGAVYGPPAGRRLVVFIDDLNMPKVDAYGTQQPIALLLFLISRGALYDRGKGKGKDLSLKHIRDLSFIAAMGPPGGGRNGTDPRFLSLFNAYNVVAPSAAVLKHIYGSIFAAHLVNFPASVIEAGSKAADATLKVFSALVEKLPPTPSKFHYIFNLRDLSRIFEGLCLATEDKVSDSAGLARLWRHECLRVLGDRLVGEADAAVLAAELAGAARAAWPEAADAALADSLLFGDFEHVVKRLRGEGEDPRLYGDIGNHENARRVFEEVLENYNMDHKPMNLVLFESAVEHLTRLHRVLRVPRGNALLVGVGGSGKRSLARLAAFCAGCGLFEVALVRNYGEAEFREDLRALYRQLAAGPVAFLLTDAHVVEEGFLEAVNNMLTTGIVPGLFERDEADQLAGTLRTEARAAGLPDTSDARWQFFVDRCRDNLHIVLAMSPSGDKLRIRCRNFPGLISGCIVDWFQPWPSAALHKVAEYFLQDEPLPEQQVLRDAVVGHLVKTHETVVAASAHFADVMRRHYYVTPANYLDFISNYRSALKDSGRRNHASTKRLEGGLAKLVEAAAAVDAMQEELKDKKVVVDEKTRNVEALIAEIQSKSAVAGRQQSDASVKQRQVLEQAEVITKEKAVADEALMEALPAVEAAAAALENLDKKDLDEIKAFNSPPQLVKDVCMQVCILRPGGDKYEEAWADAKKMLGNSKLLDLLKNYPKDSITSKMMSGVKRYFKNPSLTVDNMRSVSKAGTGLLTWVVAISKYFDIAKNVEPLRNKVRDMERAQQQSTTELEDLMQLLSSLNAEIAELNTNYALANAELTELQLEASVMEKRLAAASKLITGLAGERTRWTGDVGDLGRQRERLVGDCLLSASFLSYLGAFTAEFRADLLHGAFLPDLLQRNVAVTQPFRLETLLTTDATVQQWVSRGLPSDAHSVQNGILTTKASRFPLCVDPQQQAVAWIKNTYAKDGLTVKALSEPDFMKHLELAIQFGKPFLFEGIDEELDPMLDPVLDKNIIQDGASKTIKLGDKTIDWDDNFRLLFTTKLANPHYSPEVMGKTMIINYGVTMEGLAEQLLNEVVAHERPDLEESYASLVKEMSDSAMLIVALEDTLLKELSSSQGNILDNEELIKTLDDTKTKAEDIKSKFERARFTRDEISETRAVYKPVAKRGSILYFAESGLVAVLGMYEMSLDSFLGVFRRALAAAKRDAVLDTRIANMAAAVTRLAYEHTCTGIFERHKLMFSFQMTCMIMEGDGRLDRRELDFFLKGDTSLSTPAGPPPASWIGPQGWKDLLCLTSMHNDSGGGGDGGSESGANDEGASSSKGTGSGGGGRGNNALAGLLAHLEKHPAEWRAWFDLEAPEAAPLPLLQPEREGGTSSSEVAAPAAAVAAALSPLQRLGVLRCLRPDRAYNAVKVMVAGEMGDKYVQPPVLDYARIFQQSGPSMPMVFILSPGANPQADIAALGAELGFSGSRLKFLALGQGQGPLAEQMMEQGYQKGHWVLLQNCHLLASWLRRLEKWLERAKTPHKDFRLWLTTEPTDKFPMGILQRSLKVVTEPPDGLKQNMRSTYAKMDAAALEECPHPAYRPCLYVLAFLHAVVLERRKYGKIGWNVRYDFNESDFMISRRLLALYLEKAHEDGDEALPWGSLKYLVGDAMYGGRVSDDMDRRVLSTYLAEYMGDFLFDDCQRFYFSRAGHNYRVPDATSHGDFVAEVESLPLNNSPAVFGLHPNAEIGYYTDAARDMWRDLIGLQPRKAGGGGGQSREARIAATAADVRAQVPLLSPDVGSYDLMVVRRRLLERNDGAPPTPLQVVLLQELERWNVLVVRMAASLKDLARALAGEIGMSDELDALGDALFNGFLPAAWRRLCPSTQKPLGPWMQHFTRRHAQYEAWIEHGEPAVMWLAGLHVPESYLTALVQTTCRANNWPLDKSTLYTVVTTIDAATAEAAPPAALTSGCYLSGLYLEGAGWDIARQCLVRQGPKVLVEELPLLQVIPVEANKLKLHGTFRAPVYVTQERRNAMGVGLVFEADLCTAEHPSHWVLQGVALTLNVAS